MLTAPVKPVAEVAGVQHSLVTMAALPTCSPGDLGAGAHAVGEAASAYLGAVAGEKQGAGRVGVGGAVGQLPVAARPRT